LSLSFSSLLSNQFELSLALRVVSLCYGAVHDDRE
jgi:hypothetical protein